MTPMIDVVFLLIIFFLVSSHLARQESRLPVELPVAESHAPLDLEPVSMTVTINQDQQILIGGTPIAIEALRPLLLEIRNRDGSAASLRVRTDAVVPYQVVEPVLHAAAIAGVLDIKLAVKDPR
ncbi:ExbD/TolR family protein [Roseiconus lacunae]